MVEEPAPAPTAYSQEYLQGLREREAQRFEEMKQEELRKLEKQRQEAQRRREEQEEWEKAMRRHFADEVSEGLLGDTWAGRAAEEGAKGAATGGGGR